MFCTGKYKKALRRIPLREVKAILRGKNSKSETFYLHLHKEYDYQYRSEKWEKIVSSICETVARAVGTHPVIMADLTTKELSVTVKTKQSVKRGKTQRQLSPESAAVLRRTHLKLEFMLSRNLINDGTAKKADAGPPSLPLTTSTHSTPMNNANALVASNLKANFEKNVIEAHSHKSLVCCQHHRRQ